MPRTSHISLVALVGVNLVPLFGVVFFGWSLFSIMLLYWLENGIIGLLNVAKIARAEAPASAGSRMKVNGRDASSLGKAAAIAFFVLHYGIFWVVHGVFVVALFGVLGGTLPTSGSPFPALGSGFAGFEPVGVAVAFVSLVLSHGLSFFVNFIGDEEYREVSPGEQMMRPYSRVVALHAAILGGGFLAGYLGAPVAALAVLVLVKTSVDVLAHAREHRKARSAPEGVASA